MESLRTAIQKPLATRLRAEADRALKQGPWSVTYHRPSSPKIDIHDYFSEGPYWWPDPKNPGGPYIRRDGERNPDRFNNNHDDLARMGEAVLTLGAAAYLLNEPAYGDRAAELVRVWFLDPKTRVNPHLEYGQAVRGHNDGRGTGIIDTRPLIWCAQGLSFLEATDRWKPAERDGVKKWYADYIRWLTTSKKGLDEKNSGNNHMTWWTAQVASYAAFTGDTKTMEMCWKHYREVLVPNEIRPDGSCPKEEGRTKSLGYSAMNLDAFATICRVAQTNGAALWSFKAPTGVSLSKSIDYLAPYMEKPALWKKPQIAPFHSSEYSFLALAGMGMHNTDCVALYNRLTTKSDTTWQVLVQMLLAKNEAPPRDPAGRRENRD
jgi:hypothetical protein